MEGLNHHDQNCHTLVVLVTGRIGAELRAEFPQIATIAERLSPFGGTCQGFDIAVVARPSLDLDGPRDAGATWAMHAFGRASS